MIIHLEKYLIFGLKNDLDRFFKAAQKGGFIEFISPHRKKREEMPKEGEKIVKALKILKKQPVLPSLEKPPLDPEEIAGKIIHCQEAIEEIQEQKRLLQAEIARVGAFGDFSTEDIAYVENEGKRYLQFFCVKTEKREQIELPPDLLYVGTEYDLDYFVGIHKEKKSYPDMIEIHIEKPVGILRAHLEALEMQSKELHTELKSYAAYKTYLQKGLTFLLNEFHLDFAKKSVSLEVSDSLFFIEAWVPETKKQALEKLFSSFSVEGEVVKVEKEETVPTYTENSHIGKMGEDLVEVYDTPSSTDKDPSLWVLSSFALFFAMIVSDAGYGFLYLALGLFLAWKYKDGGKKIKRMIHLVILLGSTCIIWGVITASYLGISIDPKNPIRKSSLIHYFAVKKAEYHREQKDDIYEFWTEQYPDTAKAKSGEEFLFKASKWQDGEVRYEALDDFYDTALMEISLFVGMIHIALSFLRYLKRNFSGLGWIIFMVGGYLFFPSILRATSFVNYLNWIPKEQAYFWGKYMVFSGIGFAVVAAIIQHRLSGLGEILNVIQVFADVLSYLRLYALGLAGMIVAATFNQMGQSIGLGIGFIVIILGQGVNIALGVMGGVIHGLRLNFLEWYHYSFEGGGRLFNPLRLLKR